MFVQKSAETPNFVVFLTDSVLKKTYLDQMIAPEKAKLGPDNNTTAYACMCIYIYMATDMSAAPKKTHFPKLSSKHGPKKVQWNH